MSAPTITAPPVDWGRRNLRLLAIFGPVLIATGVAGLTLPAGAPLMSRATPYDIFHIAFGALGLVIAVGRSRRFAAVFNLGFGALDLYQAAAGLAGIFPAAWFGLRPGDHLVHVVLGTLLVAFGAHVPGRRRP
jgi:hypothetical protein